jgi:hypothetical protein
VSSFFLVFWLIIPFDDQLIFVIKVARLSHEIVFDTENRKS